MIGRRLEAPNEICDSGIIQIVGKERHQSGCRFKVQGAGNVVYWCQEVVDGKPRGNTFAVGSDETANWKAVDNS